MTYDYDKLICDECKQPLNNGYDKQWVRVQPDEEDHNTENGVVWFHCSCLNIKKQ